MSAKLGSHSSAQAEENQSKAMKRYWENHPERKRLDPAAELSSLRSALAEKTALLESHGPEGHNATNEQFVTLRS